MSSRLSVRSDLELVSASECNQLLVLIECCHLTSNMRRVDTSRKNKYSPTLSTYDPSLEMK